MRLLPGPTAKALICGLFLAISARALTLEEIEATPNLNPQSFARFFSSFQFSYHDDIQSPEVFLATRSGDCDDYAVLAARVLRSKGYTPRLIAVRMPKVTHVVCYIDETNCYLDYNQRTKAGTVPSGPDVSAIARGVARSYGLKWTSASEFTFDQGVKRLVQTVVDRNDRQVAALTR